jgi:iron-sulfur cluster assembly protein
MDWEDSAMSSRFVFSNPNEIARCGCGESFTVAEGALPA